jgi:hypothetical protein
MRHPTAERLEATVFGWLPEAEAREIRAHAGECPTCGKALRRDEDVHRRLSLLRAAEPRLEVAEGVLARIDDPARPKLARRSVRVAILVAALALAGVLVVGNGPVRRTVKRVSAAVIP